MPPFNDLIDFWEEVMAVLIFVALSSCTTVTECVPESRVPIDDLAKLVVVLMLALGFRAGVTVEGALAKASSRSKAIRTPVSDGCMFVDEKAFRN